MSKFEKFMQFVALYLAAAGSKDWCVLKDARDLREYFPDLSLEPIDPEQRAWEYFEWIFVYEGMEIRKPKWLSRVPEDQKTSDQDDYMGKGS